MRSQYLVLLVTIALALAQAGRGEPSERFGRFGELTLYRETPQPGHVVLFVSGDGGWNQGVVDMAKALASLDALVVGIDIRTYLDSLRSSHEKCLYPAADFEALSQYLQKKLDFPSYQIPLLVGYSSGATLVYATLAQAPQNTFRGGISLGFCPELALAKPFCRGSGLASSHLDAKGRSIAFEPIAAMLSPWVVFQGSVDQVCDATATQRYVSRVGGAELVTLPKVGHGFSVQKNWMPQFRDAFRRLAPPSPGKTEPRGGETSGATSHSSRVAGVSDLPIVEVPATSGHSKSIAFIASGDGGWASLDQQIGGVLAAEGVSVVGLDTLQYYWKPHSPEQSAKDLERILRYYLAVWHKERVLLIGYSRGAGVLPFMASRLPEDLMERVDLVALLGVEKRIDFEFHVGDWINVSSRNAKSVQPEIEKLRGRKLLCVYGADETDSLCPHLPVGLATLDERSGGHHFGGDYQSIAARILAEARR